MKALESMKAPTSFGIIPALVMSVLLDRPKRLGEVVHGNVPSLFQGLTQQGDPRFNGELWIFVVT